MTSIKYIVVILFSLLFSLSTLAAERDKDCLDWFNRSKIPVGSKDCELRCVTHMTDMGTFMCPDQCDILCKAKEADSTAGKLIYYPGLTPAEKKLADKNPKDAITVFVQKTRAEWSAGRNFPDQGMNDESDAFRHFIWAGLLTKANSRKTMGHEES